MFGFGKNSNEKNLEQQIAETQQRLDETEQLCKAKCQEIQEKYGSTVLTVILVNHFINSKKNK